MYRLSCHKSLALAEREGKASKACAGGACADKAYIGKAYTDRACVGKTCIDGAACWGVNITGS